jgi:hypothetical protein
VDRRVLLLHRYQPRVWNLFLNSGIGMELDGRPTPCREELSSGYYHFGGFYE